MSEFSASTSNPSHQIRMEALLKAFVICTSQIDEDTPLIFERDVPVGFIDEEKNTFVLDMDKPAPELEVEQFSSALHYHEHYASALFFPYEQFEEINPLYEFIMSEFIGEDNEIPPVLSVVQDRIDGIEEVDHKENLLTVLRAGMIIDMRVNDAMQEAGLESLPPMELNQLWGEAILGSDEASEVITEAFEKYAPIFGEIADEVPDSLLSALWNLHTEVLSA